MIFTSFLIKNQNFYFLFQLGALKRLANANRFFKYHPNNKYNYMVALTWIPLIRLTSYQVI